MGRRGISLGAVRDSGVELTTGKRAWFDFLAILRGLVRSERARRRWSEVERWGHASCGSPPLKDPGKKVARTTSNKVQTGQKREGDSLSGTRPVIVCSTSKGRRFCPPKVLPTEVRSSLRLPCSRVLSLLAMSHSGAVQTVLNLKKSLASAGAADRTEASLHSRRPRPSRSPSPSLKSTRPPRPTRTHHLQPILVDSRSGQRAPGDLSEGGSRFGFWGVWRGG